MTLLTDAPLQRVRSSIRALHTWGADSSLITCRAWSELQCLADELSYCVPIIDPYDGEDLVPEELLCAVFRLAQGCAVIAYASFDGRPAGDIVKLLGFGVRDVVTRGVDDSPRRIAAAVRECAGLGELEATVADSLSRLTMQQQAIVRWSVRRGAGRTSVAELAAILGTSSRTLRRWCDGLPGASTSTLLMWGRVVHACRLMSHTTM